MKYLLLSFLLVNVFSDCFGQSESYYYDTTGNKISGLISFTGNGNISYKENTKAKKVNLSPADNISSFVVGKDSFSVFSGLQHPFTTNEKRFVHILEDGKIKLYDFSMLFSKTNNKLGKDENPYYYIEKSGKTYKINEIGWMYNFRKVIHEILIDYPELENEYIKSNKLYITNLRFIVQKYNAHFRQV